MLDANDMDLVREYASRNSEQAFETLVHRHINLVHSVALRHVRNPAHAEEVTQAVFIILARKAASLRPGTVLGGWLYETARLSSGSFLRGEHRRQRREQEAHMQSIVHESANDSAWEQLAPHLDEAMAALGEKDRNAVVLRFFQNKNAREIADSLGVEESAAQKRVSRAVEKLRSFFTKRGVTLSATAVCGAIAANSVQAAPVGLAATVAVAAAKGSAVTASTLTLVKGALKFMAWTKAKKAVVTGAAIILATGTTTMVVQKITAPSASDLSWADDPKYWELDFGDPDPRKSVATRQAIISAFEERVKKLPPVLILRPTRFKTNLGEISSDDKIIARGRPLSQLLRIAYDKGYAYRAIVPPHFPMEKFDLMLTLPERPREALQEEIKKKFGYVAHREIIETNVLILRVKHSVAPALQLTKGGDPSYPTRSPDNKIAIKNQQLSGVAGCFSALLKTMVVDQTKIEGNYDIALQWQSRAGESDEDAIKRAVLEQLGLEFIPSRESIKYLVVEKLE